MPKHKMPIQASISKAKVEKVLKGENREFGHLGAYGNIKFNILSHFVKGKTFLTPMETIFIIPRELEYLEVLVKLARKKKDVEVVKHK
jgi:hypothetical protein